LFSRQKGPGCKKENYKSVLGKNRPVFGRFSRKNRPVFGRFLEKPPGRLAVFPLPSIYSPWP
jgi:hypothetical protein